MNRRFGKVGSFLVLGTICVVGMVAATALGVFDYFAKDGTVDVTAAGAVLLYWCLASVVVIVIRYWHAKGELTLLAGALLTALLVVEVVLRVFVLFPERTLERAHGLSSTRLNHVYPANAVMFDRHVKNIIWTNEDGWRTSYSREEFRAHRERIAVLGDSFVFGAIVSQEHSVPHAMEKFLRDSLRRDDLAVLNAGIPSYSPLIERIAYNDIVRHYEPTIVILVLDASDFGDDPLPDHTTVRCINWWSRCSRIRSHSLPCRRRSL